jgi:hypothetical protein
MMEDHWFCSLCGSFGGDFPRTFYGEYSVVETRVCEECADKLYSEGETGCTVCGSEVANDLTYVGGYDSPLCDGCFESLQEGPEKDKAERAKGRAWIRKDRLRNLCDACLENEGLGDSGHANGTTSEYCQQCQGWEL